MISYDEVREHISAVLRITSEKTAVLEEMEEDLINVDYGYDVYKVIQKLKGVTRYLEESLSALDKTREVSDN